MQFRKVKVGSNVDVDGDQEGTNLTPLQLQRIQFLRSKKMTKTRENSTLGTFKSNNLYSKITKIQSKVKKSRNKG
jgi:hypothetical protein